MIADPPVRARRVQQHVRTQIRQHQRFAKHAGAEVRHDERDARIRECDRVEIERVAEPHVEAARQAEPLAHADRQDAAVHEHRGAFPVPGDLDELAGAVVVDGVAMHRRKQAEGAEPIVERTPPPQTKPVPAKVDEPKDEKGMYTVRRGDTLLRIALDHGQNYRDLVAWNNLRDPDDIKVGQVLRVAAPEEKKTAGVVTQPVVTTRPPTRPA